MTKQSSLIQRSNPRKDEEAGDEIIPLASSRSTNLSGDNDDGKDKAADAEGGFCRYLLIMIVMNVVIYHFITPAHVKTAQKKAMDEQLFRFSEHLREQRASMESLLDDRTQSLDVLKSSEDQTQALKTQTQSILDQLSLVSKGHHEKEVGMLESDVTKYKGVADDLEATKAKLEAEMKAQQATLDELRTTIAERDGELKSLQESMKTMKADASLFCSDCVFNRAKMGRVTCQGRADYLVSKHNTPHDDAIQAVMKWEPINCVKKPDDA